MQAREHHGLVNKFPDLIRQRSKRKLTGDFKHFIKAVCTHPQGNVNISCDPRFAIKQDSLPAYDHIGNGVLPENPA